MALSVVKEVILRAATDADFRELFFKDTEAVLSRYELSEEEKQCLREDANEDKLQSVAIAIQAEAVTCANDIRL